MKTILIFLFYLYSSSALSYENSMAARGGVGSSYANIHAFNSSKDKFIGLGFTTQLSYRLIKWEVSLSSYIYWGKVKGLEFSANDSNITGVGQFRHVSFGPVLKYFFDWRLAKNWNFYAGAGPVWSLQTINLDRYQLSKGSFDPNYKLTYLSRGGLILIGIEEILPFKEMHPVFFEVIYSYKESKKVSVVDATSSAEVNTISTEEGDGLIRGNFIMFNTGITFY